MAIFRPPACVQGCRSCKRLIVAHVIPDASGRAFALRQDRDRRVIEMQPLDLEHMSLDQIDERLEGEGNVTDLIGQR